MKLTRAMRAERLLGRLKQGPSVSYATFGIADVVLSQEDKQKIASRVERDMRLWLDSWVIPDTQRLIPEIAKKETL